MFLPRVGAQSVLVYLLRHPAMLRASPRDPASIHPSALPTHWQLLHVFKMAALAPLLLLHSSQWEVRVAFIYCRAVDKAEGRPQRGSKFVLGASDTLHLRLRLTQVQVARAAGFIHLDNSPQHCGDCLHPPDRVPQELTQRQGRVPKGRLDGWLLAKALPALPRVIHHGP